MPGPPFYAGQDLTAAELNAAFPLLARLASTVSKVSSTAFTDVVPVSGSGLLVPVEANAIYALDGWIAYNSGATPDLKLQTIIPAGASGSWSLYGLQTSSTGSVGSVQANRADMGSGNVLTAAGSDAFSTAMACLPRGVLQTGANAGDFKFQYAQNTSNAGTTSIVVGSWIRLTRLV